MSNYTILKKYKKKINKKLKLYGFKFFLRKTLERPLLFLIKKTSNDDIKSLTQKYRDKKYLKRYLNVLDEKKINIDKDYYLKSKKKIWVCWLQGINNAPLLVKKCINSIKENSKGHEVIILNKNNFSNYINLPNYIITKWEKGKISNAHFSDLIRISLLSKYGGIWIDATVYLTDDLPEYISNSNLFMYQQSMIDYSPMKGSNWLLSCEPNNLIINGVKRVLFKYWEEEDYVINYFLFHLIWSLVCEYSDQYKNEWEKVNYFSNVPPHILQFELFEKFSDKRWDQIKQKSAIHKLTWKIKPKESKEKETFYKKIFDD